MDGEAFAQLSKEESRDFAVDWVNGKNIGVPCAAQKLFLGLSKEEKSPQFRRYAQKKRHEF